MSFWDRFRRNNRRDHQPSTPLSVKPSPVPHSVDSSSTEATIPLRRGWLLQPGQKLVGTYLIEQMIVNE